MRKLVLALMVVIGGLSVVQNADAFWGRRYHSRCQQHRPSRIYEDSGIAFEVDWHRTQRRHRPSRIYEDSGIAFEADWRRTQGRHRPSRIYEDSGIAFDY